MQRLEALPLQSGLARLSSSGMLRCSTAGSVDDGKSTLIGRLLFDAKSILQDQIEAVQKVSDRRGFAGLDLALLTDGLIAEREQGITIDVAYRYFATARRKFILADTPGHEQYTRNMVTGASTADLAIILVDASKGVLTQSRRHAYIANLLGIEHLVVAVNKMDLVSFSQAAFDAIVRDFEAFVAPLGVRHLHFLPLSALHGDMVVERGERLNWYRGPTLLELLETAPNPDYAHNAPLRFPVQKVMRPQTPEWRDFRGYMGRIETGQIRVGDAITVLPSGVSSRIAGIHTFDGDREQARAGQSVTLTVADHVDISRGDMIVHCDQLPRVDKNLEATLCWMGEEPLSLQRRYVLKHTTRVVKALVSELRHRVDVDTLEPQKASTLQMNDIGRVHLRTQQPLVWDPYSADRFTGAFILIDDTSNRTVAAGILTGAADGESVDGLG